MNEIQRLEIIKASRDFVRQGCLTEDDFKQIKKRIICDNPKLYRSSLGELAMAKGLRDNGTLSEDEYTNIKQQFLSDEAIMDFGEIIKAKELLDNKTITEEEYSFLKTSCFSGGKIQVDTEKLEVIERAYRIRAVSEKEHSSLRIAAIKNVPTPSAGMFEKILKMKTLQDKGILTESEFETIRQHLLQGKDICPQEKMTQLEEYKELLDQGAITQNDYNEQKKAVIPEPSQSSYQFYDDDLTGTKTEERRKDDEYLKAKNLLAGGKRKDSVEAINILEQLGDWKDSTTLITTTKKSLAKAKRKGVIVAIITVIAICAVFAGIFLVQQNKQEKIYESFKPEFERAAKNAVNISASDDFTVGLERGNTVTATKIQEGMFASDGGQTNVGDWKDIVAVSAGECHTVGLKKDGTVVSTKVTGKHAEYSDDGQTAVEDWKDIVAVSANDYHTVGLKKDGTVISTSINDSEDDGQSDVSDWKDIVAISAGTYHTVGLKKDGTVISTSINDSEDDFGQTDVVHWKGIVAISAGLFHTVGLKSDGTVVSTKINNSEYDGGQTDVSDWEDIVAISAGGNSTVGLRRDGTVVATGYSRSGLDNVSDWKDIVAISAGKSNTVGLKKDGTAIATKINADRWAEDHGQTDVENWKDLMVIGY